MLNIFFIIAILILSLFGIFKLIIEEKKHTKDKFLFSLITAGIISLLALLLEIIFGISNIYIEAVNNYTTIKSTDGTLLAIIFSILLFFFLSSYLFMNFDNFIILFFGLLFISILSITIPIVKIHFAYDYKIYTIEKDLEYISK